MRVLATGIIVVAATLVVAVVSLILQSAGITNDTCWWNTIGPAVDGIVAVVGFVTLGLGVWLSRARLFY